MAEIGKKQDKQKIKEALLKRALGYDYEEKIMEARKDGTQKVRVIKRHVPPDTKAAERIYFLIESGRW